MGGAGHHHTLLYRFLVAFLRLVVSVFFRRIEVVGQEHVPNKGPVIFVGNHPNSLIDPVLLTTTCRRRVHFLAKDTLWKQPYLRPILNILGAIPVKRRVDHKGGKLDNASAFDALYELLLQGGFCGIFPEGISHAGSELAPLKTGAARIAFGAAKAGRERGDVVRIVPCGLTYKRRTRMRGRVLVQYGPPIEITAERQESWTSDERAAVRALTDDIDTSLRALTINAPDFDTLRILDMVRRVYTPADRELTLDQKTELTRRFLDHYPRYKDHPDVSAIYNDTWEYLGRVDALGLTDYLLRHPISFGSTLKLALRHWILLFVLAPLTLPGLLLHAPVLLMAILAGDGLTPRKDVIATIKVMVTTSLVPLAYAAIAAFLAWRLPFPANVWSAAGAAILLPLSGWATIRVLERQAAFRRAFWATRAFFFLGQETDRLREQRSELAERIRKTVDELVDPDLDRIIPGETKDNVPGEPSGGDDPPDPASEQS